MSEYLLISPDELWLKGKNRKMYTQTLRDHIKMMIKAHLGESPAIKNQNQRFVIQFEKPVSKDLLASLAKIPGINTIVPSKKVGKSIEEIGALAVEEINKLDSFPSTFKVDTKRTDKTFELNSMETSRRVGGEILKALDGKIKVDVRRPEVFVSVKILADGAYVSVGNIPGIGGLPVGTNGKLVTLISGGFDSPVASYLMSKRGCAQDFIFFYAYPYVGENVKDKILEIVKVLGCYQKNSRLHIIPFGDMQNLIAESCQEEYRTILFRRSMVQVATLLAKRIKADGLLTGDALGQVSSQTIGNITLMDRSTDLPIFRPLIGFNKREVIDLSLKIGTHDISVLPHDDACSLFAPKHPVIKPDLNYWQKYTESVDFSEAMQQCLDQAESYKISMLGELTEV